ncbi:MAG: ribosomal protein S18-alanine N-acetyltransferase [Candidatus Krumholzibacteriia bacterium]
MTLTDGELRVRRARAGDLPAVERIENASFGDPWPRTALAEELHPGALRLPLVAERDGAVVGYLMAWRAADELHILNLAVDAAERCRGVGARLLTAAIAEGTARAMALVTLEVRESNAPARRFYARHGFVARGRRRRYYRDNGEDAIVMTLVLRGADPA